MKEINKSFIETDKLFMDSYKFTIFKNDNKLNNISMYIKKAINNIATSISVQKLANQSKSSVMEIYEGYTTSMMSTIVLAGPIAIHYMLFPAIHKVLSFKGGLSVNKISEEQKKEFKKRVDSIVHEAEKLMEPIQRIIDDSSKRERAELGIEFFEQHIVKVLTAANDKE